MEEKRCIFDCKYIDASGECEAIGGECIGDMCECWEDCGVCCADRDRCRE